MNPLSKALIVPPLLLIIGCPGEPLVEPDAPTPQLDEPPPAPQGSQETSQRMEFDTANPHEGELAMHSRGQLDMLVKGFAGLRGGAKVVQCFSVPVGWVHLQPGNSTTGGF